MLTPNNSTINEINKIDLIQDLIVKVLDCHYIDVSGDGIHFDAIVVSDIFLNKTRVARHRVIYDILGDRMKQEIHALSMKLYTINEWLSLGDKSING